MCVCTCVCHGRYGFSHFLLEWKFNINSNYTIIRISSQIQVDTWNLQDFQNKIVKFVYFYNVHIWVCACMQRLFLNGSSAFRLLLHLSSPSNRPVCQNMLMLAAGFQDFDIFVISWLYHFLHLSDSLFPLITYLWFIWKLQSIRIYFHSLYSK